MSLSDDLSDAEIKRLRTQLHGFFSWIDYTKALVATMVPVFVLLGSLSVYAIDRLDERYANKFAPASVVSEIKANSQISLEALRRLFKEDIEDVQLRLCNPELIRGDRSRAIEEKSSLLDRYQDIFGEQPYIPTCSEVRGITR